MHAIMNKMLKFQDVNQKVKKQSPKAEQFVICKTRQHQNQGTVYFMEWSHGLESWTGVMEWSIRVDTWSGTLE